MRLPPFASRPILGVSTFCGTLSALDSDTVMVLSSATVLSPSESSSRMSFKCVFLGPKEEALAIVSNVSQTLSGGTTLALLAEQPIGPVEMCSTYSINL